MRANHASSECSTRNSVASTPTTGGGLPRWRSGRRSTSSRNALRSGVWRSSMPSDYTRIREDNIRQYGEGVRHLAFLGRLYADRTHFIFELLQNAEDAEATCLTFELHENRLEVRHDGRPFTTE